MYKSAAFLHMSLNSQKSSGPQSIMKWPDMTPPLAVKRTECVFSFKSLGPFDPHLLFFFDTFPYPKVLGDTTIFDDLVYCVYILPIVGTSRCFLSMWFFIDIFLMPAQSQWSHLYGFSPVCKKVCFLNVLFI